MKNMKNPFKRTGFDTLISAGTSIVGNMLLEKNSVTIVDGTVEGEFIVAHDEAKDTTLQVAGVVKMSQKIIVTNVTVTGTLTCGELVVRGLLSVKSGAIVQADLIRYESLNVESDAVIGGLMQSLKAPADANVVPIKAVV